MFKQQTRLDKTTVITTDKLQEVKHNKKFLDVGTSQTDDIIANLQVQLHEKV